MTSAEFSPDGDVVVTSSADKTIKLWDLTSSKASQTFGPFPSTVNIATFHPNGSIIVAGTENGEIFVIDIRTKQKQITAARFSADGSKFASCDRAGVLMVWRTHFDTLLPRITAKDSPEGRIADAMDVAPPAPRRSQQPTPTKPEPISNEQVEAAFNRAFGQLDITTKTIAMMSGRLEMQERKLCELQRRQTTE